MMLRDLEEGHLLALRCEKGNLFAEFIFLAESGIKYKVLAFNAASTPIRITFEGPTFTAGFTTLTSVPSLGEVEAVNSSTQGFAIEGDFGLISVIADRVELEAIPAA
jgi:hypothetical protein